MIDNRWYKKQLLSFDLVKCLTVTPAHSRKCSTKTKDKWSRPAYSRRWQPNFEISRFVFVFRVIDETQLDFWNTCLIFRLFVTEVRLFFFYLPSKVILFLNSTSHSLEPATPRRAVVCWKRWFTRPTRQNVIKSHAPLDPLTSHPFHPPQSFTLLDLSYTH